MFKCYDCGHVFDDGEPKAVVEPHGEKHFVCPVCYSEYDECFPCTDCGKQLFASELYSGGLCRDCVIDLVTPITIRKYVKDTKTNESFYVWFLTLHYIENPEPDLVEWGERYFCYRAWAYPEDTQKRCEEYVSEDIEHFASWFDKEAKKNGNEWMPKLSNGKRGHSVFG